MPLPLVVDEPIIINDSPPPSPLFSCSNYFKKNANLGAPVCSPGICKIKKFTIPKKRTYKQELFQDVSLQSREFVNDLQPILLGSFWRTDYISSFEFIKAMLVENEKLMKEFQERRKDLRNQGRSDKELLDQYAFLYMRSLDEVQQICMDGLTVNNCKDSALGRPNMGVTLFKHADIVSPFPLTYNHQAYIIVFKIIKGKIKLFGENCSHLEPTPNYDCHLSKYAISFDSSTPLKELYNNTQVYLYEYTDDGIENKPRHIYPYAVIEFVYKGNSSIWKSRDRKPALSKSLRPINRLKLWIGKLHYTKVIVDIELYSYFDYMKPAKVGSVMKVVTQLPLDMMRDHYMKNMLVLSKRRECIANGHYLLYTEMCSENEVLFSKIIRKLKDQKMAGVVGLELVTLLLIPTCDITNELGISKAGYPANVLHCVLTSRKPMLHRVTIIREALASLDTKNHSNVKSRQNSSIHTINSLRSLKVSQTCVSSSKNSTKDLFTSMPPANHLMSECIRNPVDFSTFKPDPPSSDLSLLSLSNETSPSAPLLEKPNSRKSSHCYRSINPRNYKSVSQGNIYINGSIDNINSVNPKLGPILESKINNIHPIKQLKRNSLTTYSAALSQARDPRRNKNGRRASQTSSPIPATGYDEDFIEKEQYNLNSATEPIIDSAYDMKKFLNLALTVRSKRNVKWKSTQIDESIYEAVSKPLMVKNIATQKNEILKKLPEERSVKVDDGNKVTKATKLSGEHSHTIKSIHYTKKFFDKVVKTVKQISSNSIHRTKKKIKLAPNDDQKKNNCNIFYESADTIKKEVNILDAAINKMVIKELIVDENDNEHNPQFVNELIIEGNISEDIVNKNKQKSQSSELNESTPKVFPKIIDEHVAIQKNRQTNLFNKDYHKNIPKKLFIDVTNETMLLKNSGIREIILTETIDSGLLKDKCISDLKQLIEEKQEQISDFELISAKTIELESTCTDVENLAKKQLEQFSEEQKESMESIVHFESITEDNQFISDVKQKIMFNIEPKREEQLEDIFLVELLSKEWHESMPDVEQKILMGTKAPESKLDIGSMTEKKQEKTILIETIKQESQLNIESITDNKQEHILCKVQNIALDNKELESKCGAEFLTENQNEYIYDMKQLKEDPQLAAGKKIVETIEHENTCVKFSIKEQQKSISEVKEMSEEQHSVVDQKIFEIIDHKSNYAIEGLTEQKECISKKQGFVEPKIYVETVENDNEQQECIFDVEQLLEKHMSDSEQKRSVDTIPHDNSCDTTITDDKVCFVDVEQLSMELTEHKNISVEPIIQCDMEENTEETIKQKTYVETLIVEQQKDTCKADQKTNYLGIEEMNDEYDCQIVFVGPTSEVDVHAHPLVPNKDSSFCEQADIDKVLLVTEVDLGLSSKKQLLKRSHEDNQLDDCPPFKKLHYFWEPFTEAIFKIIHGLSEEQQLDNDELSMLIRIKLNCPLQKDEDKWRLVVLPIQPSSADISDLDLMTFNDETDSSDSLFDANSEDISFETARQNTNTCGDNSELTLKIIHNMDMSPEHKFQASSNSSHSPESSDIEVVSKGISKNQNSSAREEIVNDVSRENVIKEDCVQMNIHALQAENNDFDKDLHSDKKRSNSLIKGNQNLCGKVSKEFRKLLDLEIKSAELDIDVPEPDNHFISSNKNSSEDTNHQVVQINPKPSLQIRKEKPTMPRFQAKTNLIQIQLEDQKNLSETQNVNFNLQSQQIHNQCSQSFQHILPYNPQHSFVPYHITRRHLLPTPQGLQTQNSMPFHLFTPQQFTNGQINTSAQMFPPVMSPVDFKLFCPQMQSSMENISMRPWNNTMCSSTSLL